MQDNIDKIEESKPKRDWIIAIIVCVVVWLGGAAATRWYATTHYESTDPNATAGVFGDSFGAVNALISALAFAGVIVTFRLQRKELDLQRHELNLQYQELKAQRDEFAQQNKTMKLQRFENTFFNMMQLQQQIVNDLHLQMIVNNRLRGNVLGPESYEKELRGREVIKHIYDVARSRIGNDGLKNYANIANRDLLDHYFRHLYTILRFVDETDVFVPIGEDILDIRYEWKQKYHYTTIVRATLSRYEMLILYYNGLSEFGREKLKPLIEKYALLDNIDKYSLTCSGEYKKMLGFNPSLRENRMALARYDVTWTDYEFYLTKEANDSEKYNIHAFGYGDKEIEKARQAIRNFQAMLEDVKNELVEKQ